MSKQLKLLAILKFKKDKKMIYILVKSIQVVLDMFLHVTDADTGWDCAGLAGHMLFFVGFSMAGFRAVALG